MTNTSTCVNDVISALVVAMRAASGYRSPWASGTGIPVYHSIEAGLFSEPATSALVIGFPGVPGDETDSGSTDQRIATLGTLRHRTEDATIRCLAVAQSGNTDDGSVQAAWSAATDIVDDLDTVLRASPNLGLVPAYRDLTAYITGVQSRPYLAVGPVVELHFDINVTARI